MFDAVVLVYKCPNAHIYLVDNTNVFLMCHTASNQHRKARSLSPWLRISNENALEQHISLWTRAISWNSLINPSCFVMWYFFDWVQKWEETEKCDNECHQCGGGPNRESGTPSINKNKLPLQPSSIELQPTIRAIIDKHSKIVLSREMPSLLSTHRSNILTNYQSIAWTRYTRICKWSVALRV